MPRRAGRPRNTPLPAQLPNRLLAVRKDLDIPLAEVSRRTGMKAETIRRYETGEREPSTGKLRRLAEAMGKRLEDVLLPGDTRAATPAVTPPAPPTPSNQAAIRKKAVELALLLADENGSAGQPAEVITETIALVDALRQRFSRDGK